MVLFVEKGFVFASIAECFIPQVSQLVCVFPPNRAENGLRPYPDCLQQESGPAETVHAGSGDYAHAGSATRRKGPHPRRGDNLIEAYEILQLECELLHERIKLIEYSKTCPHDLVSVISTLIWASHRVDIKELVLIRKQFAAKYGKKFEENAMRNVDGVLNERVVSKLSVEPPAAYLVQTYLERICEHHNVEWTPSVKLTAESAVQPMVSGVCLLF
jgi:hypothetical protein